MSLRNGVLKVFLLTWLSFILAALAMPARAEVEQPVDIGRITVMAPQPGVEITTEKTIIRMDEFKTPGEVRTLTDVLTEIGGIDVQRANPLLASPGDEVSIRGLNEGRMVIEIDGRRINQTGHVGRYIVDWSTLNMDDVERIEVIRGGHSVLHPFAIGGVINIITKKGKKTDNPRPEASLQAGYGRYDTYNVAATIDGGASNVVGYHLSASRQDTDGYLRNNFQDADDLNGHLTFFLPHEATFEMGAKYSDISYGFPVINDPNDPNPAVAALYDNDYPKFERGRDQLRHLDWPQLPGGPTPEWEKHTTYWDGIFQMPWGPGTAKLHGFWTEGRRWTSSYEKAGTFTEDYFVDDRTKGVIAEYKDIALLDSHRVTVGAEYQELGWPDENPTIFQVKSAYAQDVWKLGQRWTVTPGIRYYDVDMDVYMGWWEMGFDEEPVGWPFAFDNTGKTEEDDGFYPSLKVDFQVTPETALYAAASRSYRLPCP
jgi:outer membrane receptor protein involved in Fe transport